MYNSIQQFNEFGVGKIEKIIKEFLEDGSKGIGDLVMAPDIMEAMFMILLNIKKRSKNERYKRKSEKR
ncbi:MAG: hypothetical protein CVV02_12010 [Firmicutes bacterium HGW-Firmicutes-7]|nr:MAG: hypothetical protein CVV02_12010 [Firmicutes bacterium HGW-Firmicutes-7]